MAKSNRRRLWLLLAIVGIALIVGGVVVGPTNVLRHLVLLLSEDTEYASGYSESAFRGVEIGESEASVRAALGEPLHEYEAKVHSLWLYAPDPHPDFALTGEYPDVRFSFTTIRFDEDGRFESAFGQLTGGTTTSGLSTRTSATFGPGQNTLGLTTKVIEELVASRATSGDIVARFGPPQAKFRSNIVRWLVYSHSPTSTHYRQRMIGVDRDGCVCRKVSEVYWD